MNEGGLDYRRVVFWHRVLKFSLFAAFAGFAGLGWLPWSVGLRTLLLAAPSLVILVSADRMLRAQRKDSHVRGSYILLLFVPFFNFFAVLLILDQAADDLRRRGLRIAWHGVPRSELHKLLPHHCPGCGYDRAGLAADAPCPECGTTPERVNQPTSGS